MIIVEAWEWSHSTHIDNKSVTIGSHCGLNKNRMFQALSTVWSSPVSEITKALCNCLHITSQITFISTDSISHGLGGGDSSLNKQMLIIWITLCCIATALESNRRMLNCYRWCKVCHFLVSPWGRQRIFVPLFGRRLITKIYPGSKSKELKRNIRTDTGFELIFSCLHCIYLIWDIISIAAGEEACQ